MWQGRLIRTLGISLLLATSGLAAAGVAPQAPRELEAWYGGGLRHAPFFKEACGGAMVTEMGQAFACHRHDIYYARFAAAPKIA